MRRGPADRWHGEAIAAEGSLLAALAALAAMVVACYGGVLFGGQQFAFRDSAHFYYPLYWRVQQEWSAGRLPMWEPGSNGGMPMIGTPMAAVLYPGKLVFALVPYAWGVRLYTVGHEVLAFWAMMALMRSWGVSRTGATMAGLSYAFGGPVLSDYFNIIYLVGASWVPLGFRAADRWLRLGRRWGVVELTVVLAMQVLGGDPESAYLTTLCALGYGVGLASSEAGAPPRPWAWLLGLVGVAAVWMWAGPWLVGRVREAGARGARRCACRRGPWASGSMRRPGGAGRDRGWWRCSLGLGAAGLLALLLAAVQVLPVLDHITASVRWAGVGPEDLYDSSLLPYRAFEWIWPNVSGTFTAGNRYWIPILPPTGAHRPSPLSLYAGALPIVLAIARGRVPRRSSVAGLDDGGRLAEFLGESGRLRRAVELVGRPAIAGAGDDSFYGLLTIVLPALRLFRFPYKLLTFTAVGLSALAGLGWDRVSSGVGRRRTLNVAVVLLLPTVLCLAAAAGMRGRLAAAIARRASSHLVFGPIDPAGAAGAIVRGLAHGAVALASGVAVLAWSAGRRGAIAAAIAMALLMVDLSVANSPLVFAIPQADFEREPEALRAIREAERNDPSPGPFRIHRMPSWVPVGWADPGRTRRLRGAGRLGDRHAPAQLRLAAWPPLRLRGRERDRPRRPAPAVPAGEPGARCRPVGRAGDRARPTSPLPRPGGVRPLGARYFIIPAPPGNWTGDGTQFRRVRR